MTKTNSNKSTAKFDELSNLLNQKLYSMKYIKGIPRSSMSRLQDEGLLDKDQEDSPKWRKFNLITILWLSIIMELKAFGFSSPKIKMVKPELFKLIALDNGLKLPLLEHCVIEAMVYAVPTFLVVDKSGQVEIIDDQEYIRQLQTKNMENHIIININQAIKDNITPLYTEPNYTQTAELSKEEIEVLAAVRKKDFQSIQITKKNGAIDMIEGIESVKTEEKIANLLKQGKYQNIEVKQENGKIVCINRKVKMKITKD